MSAPRAIQEGMIVDTCLPCSCSRAEGTANAYFGAAPAGGSPTPPRCRVATGPHLVLRYRRVEAVLDNDLAVDTVAATSREGERPDEVASRAVADLRRILLGNELDGPERAAKYLLDQFYEGSLETFRTRGADHPSLQAIVDHPDSSWSKGTVHAWLQVHDLCDRAGRRDWVLGFTHLRMVLPLGDLDKQVALLDEAAAGNWTTRQVKDAVRAQKPAGGAGRKPHAPYRRALNLVRRAIGADDVLEGLEDAVRDPDVRSDIEDVMREVEHWMASMRGAMVRPEATARQEVPEAK